MDKEETRLLKEIEKCTTRKCRKYNQAYKKEKSKFKKAESKQCPQKDDMEFYKCSSEFYKGSRLEKLLKSKIKCTQKKCKTQRKRLHQYKKNTQPWF